MKKKSSIEATIFLRPSGKQENIELRNIYKEDADFIKEHDIKVSLEQINSENFAIYFDYGKKVNDDPDEDPDELTVLSFGNSCEETIKKAVNNLKQTYFLSTNLKS